MSSIKDTDEWDYLPLAPADWENPTWRPANLHIDISGLSHPGLVRPTNEDHFLTARYGRFLETLHSNIPISQRSSAHELTGYALLVADGMGGAAAGEMASKTAINLLFEFV